MTETPLKVIGDAAKFRSDLRRRIKLAGDLAARIEAARELFGDVEVPAESRGLLRELLLLPHTDELRAVEESVATWRHNNNRIVKRFLGAAGTAFEVNLVPRWRARHERKDPVDRADACALAIKEGVEVLEAVLAQLPESRALGVKSPDERFAELRASGLIEEAALDAYIKRMAKLSSRAEISGAIGSAKELIEACNRATCDLLGVSYPIGDFPRLGKTVRRELAELERGSETATKAIDQLFAGMATIEVALATLRNEVGTGHGRSTLPKGLRPRHGQLSIDIADTHARYLVTTLRDLKLV